MSEPVTNVEIEDVLLSIRRLITEGDRSGSDKGEGDFVAAVEEKSLEDSVESEGDPVSAPEAQEESSDRLVLTPALRVAGEENASEQGESDESGEEEAAPEAAELSEAAFGDATPEELASAWETDEADAPADDGLPETVDRLRAIAEEVREEFEAAEGISVERARALDSRIVHWEDVKDGDMPEADPVYEPDEPGDSDYAGSEVDPMAWQEEAVEAEPVSDVVRPKHPNVEARTYGEDMAPEEALAGLAGRIEAEAQRYVHDEIEAVADDAGLDDLDDEEAVVLDEAVLREMVTDIVRQELQGALGERITRNVRKLVRREIHRALAAHELE